jgi:hypothetical protein
MNDKMRATALSSKTIMFRVELVPVKSEPEFHPGIIAVSKPGVKRRFEAKRAIHHWT